MNNESVKELLDTCLNELNSISALLTGIGDAALPTPYMKKYAVIRASGSIETAFKKIIADKIDNDSIVQVRNYIKKMVRESSSNPRLDKIIETLGDFDERWKNKFKEHLALDDRAALAQALKDLVDARNLFAHGGHPDVCITKTISDFKHGVRVLETLDMVVSHNFDDD